MSGFWEKFKDFFDRTDAEQNRLRSEAQALQDELVELQNEARFQSEPSFAEYRSRLREQFQYLVRALVFEDKEPQRSMLQGKCQAVLEAIERPEAVQDRIGAIRARLEELRAEAFSRDDGVTVRGDTGL